MQETGVQSLGWKDPLEEGMVTCSSIPAWGITMARGAWWATVHGVTESDRTEWLSTAQRFEMASYSWSPNNELSQGWGCSEGWNPRLRSTGSVLPLRALWCLNDLPEDDTFINFFKKLFYSPQAIPRWHPLHSPCLENPMDRGAWRAAGLQRVGYTWSDLTLTHAPKRSWLFFSVS